MLKSEDTKNIEVIIRVTKVTNFLNEKKKTLQFELCAQMWEPQKNMRLLHELNFTIITVTFLK